jgi:hypothetical protein
MEIATGGDELIPLLASQLLALVTAREAGTPVLRANDLRGLLPEVPPDGVDWRTAVPDVVARLESGQRDNEIGEARTAPVTGSRTGSSTRPVPRRERRRGGWMGRPRCGAPI